MVSPRGDKRAHETPVPMDADDDDDDLFVRLASEFKPEAEQAVLFNHEMDWDNMSVEIAVDIDGKQDMLAFFENPQAFAATKIKKGRGEVSVKRLSDDQRSLFREAREKEVTQFLSKGAIRLVRLAGVPEDRIMKMRFVQTWKSTGAAKARLVLQGFTDPDLTELRSDAPTISKRGRMIFFVATSHIALVSEKADVVGAFLQSTNTEEVRNIFGMPPDELLDAMGCSRLKGKVLVQILKPVYGLTVAPRRWWQQVCKDLIRLGWTQSKVEPCFWFVLEVLTAGGCRPVAILIVHVDFFLISGNPVISVFSVFVEIS